MRTKPAKRWNSQSEHNSFGVYNWFRLKGISNKEIINEVVYSFCESNGFKGLTPKTSDKTTFNFAGNRFINFTRFAMKYMKENNYLEL